MRSGGQSAQQQPDRVAEPLELLALDAARAAEAHHDAGQREQHEDAEQRPANRDAGLERVTHGAADGERVAECAGRRRGRPCSTPNSVPSTASATSASACPQDGSPAARRQPAVGEQQREQQADEAEPDVDDRLVEPHDEPHAEARVGVVLVRAQEMPSPATESVTSEREAEEDRPDRVLRPPPRQQRADAREHAERERGQPLELLAGLRLHDHGHDGQRRPQAEQRIREAPHRSHTETWEGWTVSRTTPRRSLVSVSRSSSSRSRPPNASSVREAS